MIDVLHPGRANVPKVRALVLSAHLVFGACKCGQFGLRQPALPATVLKLQAVQQAELKERLATMYKAKDVSHVFVFGFRTQV